MPRFSYAKPFAFFFNKPCVAKAVPCRTHDGGLFSGSQKHLPLIHKQARPAMILKPLKGAMLCFGEVHSLPRKSTAMLRCFCRQRQGG